MQPIRRRLQVKQDGSFPEWGPEQASGSAPPLCSAGKHGIRRTTRNHSPNPRKEWIKKLACVVPRTPIVHEDAPLDWDSLGQEPQQQQQLFLFPLAAPSRDHVTGEAAEHTTATHSSEDPTISSHSSDQLNGNIEEQREHQGPPKQSFSSSNYYTSESTESSGIPWGSEELRSDYTIDDDDDDKKPVDADVESLSAVEAKRPQLLGIKPLHRRSASRGPDEDAFLAIPGPPSRPPSRFSLSESRSLPSVASEPVVPPAPATRTATCARSVEYTFASDNYDQMQEFAERLQRLEAFIRRVDSKAEQSFHFSTASESSVNRSEVDDFRHQDPPAHLLSTRSRTFRTRESFGEARTFDDTNSLLRATESFILASESVLNATLDSFDEGHSARRADKTASHGSNFRQLLNAVTPSSSQETDESSFIKVQTSESHEEATPTIADTSILAVKSGENNQSVDKIESEEYCQNNKLQALINRFERLGESELRGSNRTVASAPPAVIRTRTPKQSLHPHSLPAESPEDPRACLPTSNAVHRKTFSGGIPKSAALSSTVVSSQSKSPDCSSKSFFWRSFPEHSKDDSFLVDTSASTGTEDFHRSDGTLFSNSSGDPSHRLMVDAGERPPPVPGRHMSRRFL